MTWKISVRLIWQLRAMVMYLLNLLSLVAQMMILTRLRTTMSFSANTTVFHWSQRNSSRSSNTSLATSRLNAIYSATAPIILPRYILLQVRFKIRMAVSLILIQQLAWMWNYPSSNGASLIPPLGIWSSVTSSIKQSRNVKEEGGESEAVLHDY